MALSSHRYPTFLVLRAHFSYLTFSLCLTGGVLFFDDVAQQVIESPGDIPFLVTLFP